MSKEEIKYEINQVLDHLSDGALEEHLTILREIEEKNNTTSISAKFLQFILEEDKKLLEKLAQ